MDPSVQFVLFETALGTCAVVGGEAGLTGVLLPSAGEAAIRDRLARSHPAAVEAPPTPAMADAVRRIQTLLATGDADLSPIVLDERAIDAFQRAVYAIL